MHADVGYHHRPVAKRTSLLKDTFGKNTLRRKCCHRPGKGQGVEAEMG
ncbi:hypothetical protein OOU_Y34scaffold00855g5 [Pyricularia oryzae Y34]|uniref:Uncharacterized protein n=2 Tax=Pyricularia oryzae TaxID=318829 RepID=A0AA97NPF4_PYRO3|nr:hypothetical protein OOU_Y34scaffold00855g5 [Pyricularia oryzae Y34]